MIQEFEKFRIGAVDPLQFKISQSCKRARNLALSGHRDVETVHSSGVLSLDVDAEGRFLLSGCSDGSIYIHDLFNFSGSPSFTARAHKEHIIQRNHRFAHKYSTECVQWYPKDSGLFVTGSMDKTLKIWDSNQMRPVDTVKFEGRIFQVHMSPNTPSNCLVAVTGTENVVRLVDLNTGSCTHELRGHGSAVYTCRWSPRDEFLLATGGCDGQIILWDARSANTALRILDQSNGQVSSSKTKGKLTSHDSAVNGLCFTDGGHSLISLGWDAKAKLWNMTTCKREKVVYHAVHLEKRKTIQFDVAGCYSKELVYIPSNAKVLVFEVHTGKLVKTLQGHYNEVNSCRYNALHQELYTAANDHSILIWTPDLSQETAYKDHVNIQSVNKNLSQPRMAVTQDVWSSDEDG